MLKPRTILAVGLVFGLLAADIAVAQSRDDYTDAELTMQRREYSVALFAKLLCSGVFVIGRDPDEFIQNDLTRAAGLGVPGWDEISVDVNRARRSVTLSVPGITPRKAVYVGDQGCVLMPHGVDFPIFTPVRVPKTIPDPAKNPWPMGDVVKEGAGAGVDRAALAAALDRAFDDSLNAIPQKTRAMVIVHKGEIVGERYAPGFERDTRHITWSMGKSITSALVGILIGDGAFNVTDPAPVAQWQAEGDPRAAITIADLMRMSSGLKFGRGNPAEGTNYTVLDNHTYVYFGATEVFDYSVANLLEYPPNTVWRYRNCDPLTLGRIVRDTVQARGGNYLTYPQRALFDKLGMRNMVLETDIWGNFIMTGFDYGTARDWARFGLLHLWDGVWQGERILPEGWVDFVRTPAPAKKDKAYGGLFWLNAGKRYESLPVDMFWPAGHMGQVAYVVPSMDAVIVRLGHSADGGFDAYIEPVVRDILAALGRTSTD